MPRSLARATLIAAMQAEAQSHGAPLSPEEIHSLGSTPEAESPYDLEESRAAKLLRAAYAHSTGPDRKALDHALRITAQSDSHLAVIVDLAGLHPSSRQTRSWWIDRLRVWLLAALVTTAFLAFVVYATARGWEPPKERHALGWYAAASAFVLACLARLILGRERVLSILDWIFQPRGRRSGR